MPTREEQRKFNPRKDTNEYSPYSPNTWSAAYHPFDPVYDGANNTVKHDESDNSRQHDVYDDRTISDKTAYLDSGSDKEEYYRTAQLGYAPNPVERTDVGSAGETLRQTTGDGDAGKVMTSLDNTVRQNAQKMNTVSDLIRMNSELDSKSRQADADYQRRLAGWTKYRGAVDLGNAIADLFTATKGSKTAKYRKGIGQDGVVDNEFARLLRQQRADNQQLYTNALNALKQEDANEKNFVYNQYKKAQTDATLQKMLNDERKTDFQIANGTRQTDIAQQNADTNSRNADTNERKADINASSVANQNRNRDAKTGIDQQNADTRRLAAESVQTQEKEYIGSDGNPVGTVKTTTTKTANGNKKQVSGFGGGKSDKKQIKGFNGRK